ncbi:MAG: hypothetical protein QXU46_05690 [Candidatus Bathyarchaeia archaeon]
MSELVFNVVDELRREEDSLRDRFGKEFVVTYKDNRLHGVLKGAIKPDAGLVKAVYEAWCVLALINLTKPERVVDPSYEEFKVNCGFWFKRRFRRCGVHWSRADGSPIRDQVPVNVIWETLDSKVYSLAFQLDSGLTALSPEQRAWFKSVALGRVWSLGGYLMEDGVRLRPDFLLYRRWVENVVDFRNRRLPEVDILVNVEAKAGWSKDRALVKKLEEYTEAFKPKDGAFVVSLHDETPMFKCKFEVIPAGLDKNRLRELL